MRDGIRQMRFAAGGSATRILLVRHGESAAVAPGGAWPTSMGQGDPDLHPHGRVQAERVADRLVGEDVSAVYVTPFSRTAGTAAPFLSRRAMVAVVEPDLREVYLGDWDGPIFRRLVADRDPLAMRIFDEERWDLAPGAEPAHSFAARVRGAVERIATAQQGGTVAVFTHAGVIGRVLAEATGSTPFAFNGADNASISHLVVDQGKWTLRSFNDTAHLGMAIVNRSDLAWEQAPPVSDRSTG